VQLPLSDSIKDAYYVSNGSKDGNRTPNNMLIGLKSLDASGCAATNTTANWGIFRSAPGEKDSGTGQLLTKEYPNGTTIDKYYYVYGNLDSKSCNAPQDTLQAIDAAFTTAQKHMSATSD
jgi:hypothetical protein